MFVEALNNAALLSFTAVGLYIFLLSSERFGRVASTIGLGLSYGFVTFLVTVSPLVMEDGATIDTRAGPVIAAGIFGGPIAAFIAAAFGAIARWSVGGSFAVTGTIVFGLYAVIGGALWRYYLRGVLGPGVGLKRLGFAAGLSVLASGMMFFLIQPRTVALSWFLGDYPFVATANVASIAICGAIGHIVLKTAQQRTMLVEALETVELAKSAGGIGTWTFDHPAGTVAWDPVNRNLHGIEQDRANGRFEDWARTVHPEDLPRVEKEFEDALVGKKSFETVYRVVLPDQTIRDLKASAMILRDSENVPKRVVGMNFDITDILQKDRELEESRFIAAQAQKMDAIGRLTGGIAHDFNNLLAIILGNLELLVDEVHGSENSANERAEAISHAISAAERGGELTRRMLAFAKRAPLEPQRIQINEVIRETSDWLERTIPETIIFEINVDDEVWSVLLDRTGFQSVVVNIIINAMEAMPEGGRLTVEAKNISVHKESCEIDKRTIPSGNFVMFAVSDTGFGIAANQLSNIFEPFTSTKNLGIGSGLGLSMVKGFVDQSGGYIHVDSEVSVGTTVRLFFPAENWSELNSEIDRPSNDVQVPTKDRARILVAEDQPEVLSVIVRTLESAGHRVDAARNGNEALKKFAEHDLLLTDVVMPGGMLGPDLAKACRQIVPDLIVVFMTGYASRATDQGRGLSASDIRLMKPFQKGDLLKTINEQLQSRSGGKIACEI